jgi:serine/threonine protein kinase
MADPLALLKTALADRLRSSGSSVGAAWRRSTSLATRVTSRLQHPHSLPVFDSGENSGQLWYTMPFVEGESLRQRLTREKHLPLAQALRIVKDAAAAPALARR